MYVSDTRTNPNFIHYIQILIFGLIVLTATSVANAGNLKLAWNASPSPEVAGYNLYYGETSRQYTNRVDVGNTTNHTLAGIEPGKKYYVAATSYCSDCNGFQESDFSNELEVVVPASDGSNTPKVISQKGWSLVYVDSEEVAGEDGRGVNAFDGDPATFWVTEWSRRTAPLPHEIQIDLGAVYELARFRYLPPQDDDPFGAYGRIADYEFYVSDDGQTWGNPVAKGTFPNTQAEKEVAFTPASGRFIRLVALSEVHGGPWTAVGELNVVGRLPQPTPPPPPLVPELISQKGWSLVYVGSEERRREDGRGVNAFDGDPDTLWITEWSRRTAPLPHEIQIDLGAVYELARFRYLPPGDENPYGRIKDYAFYVSGDGQSWGSPAATGAFSNTAAEQEVVFEAPVSGRFIRLVALSEAHGGPWTVVAELNVVGIPLSGNLSSSKEMLEASAEKMVMIAGNSGSIDEKGSENGIKDESDPTPPLLPSVEIGEALVTHEWVKVSFQQSFADPVVVAPSFSYDNAEPGIVRIRNITSDGFEIRIQGWDSLDGERSAEQVHFFVMERGHYTLPNGARIEAGTVEMEANSAFETLHFLEPFNVSPVVLTSVTSDNAPQAITVRKQEVNTEGFNLGLHGQEAESSELEAVDYIAAEPSLGTAGSIPFEIGRTEEVMNHDFQMISFLNTYTSAPLVLLDFQTWNAPGAVSLRWDNRTADSILVKVDEAQPLEEETQPASEAGGYIVFGLE